MKKLNLTDFSNSLPAPKQSEFDNYIRLKGKKIRGLLIKSCISRVDAITKVSAIPVSGETIGLLITLNSRGNGFDFTQYSSLTTIILPTGQFVIDKDVILNMFSGTVMNQRHPLDPPEFINSLEIIYCQNDSIVVEMSKNMCVGGGTGGDGTKVKLPS